MNGWGTMPRRFRELWYSLAAIVAVTAFYLVAYLQAGALPAASSLVGHWIGVVGFVLMLMTETLYSIRKQMINSSWGSMASWLRFHIVTGLVGPYMVLLHTSMKFHGLAGVVMLLTGVVVISGVVGRYIYTSVPRAIGVTEAEVSALNHPLGEPSLETEGSKGIRTASGAALDASFVGVARTRETQATDDKRRSLARRLNRLAAERDVLATWRSFHVPLTWVLFATAFVHAFAALYYATLQR